MVHRRWLFLVSLTSSATACSLINAYDDVSPSVAANDGGHDGRGEGGDRPSPGGTTNQGGQSEDDDVAGGPAASLAGAGGEVEPNAGAGGGSADGGATSAAGAAGMAGAPNDSCDSPVIDPCSGIPHFTGSQVVDGDPQEFCDVPRFEIALAAPPQYRPPAAPATSTTAASYRVAWSTAALHVFVHVTDPVVIAQTEPQLLWDGDSIEIFASPKTPSGPFAANRSTDGGAFQLLAAPPNGAAPANGNAIFAGAGGGLALGVSSDTCLIRQATGGYVLEAKIPWVNASLAAGQPMGFNATLADGTSFQPLHRQYYGLMHLGSTPCGGGPGVGPGEPYCSSLNWCVTTALP